MHLFKKQYKREEEQINAKGTLTKHTQNLAPRDVIIRKMEANSPEFL